MEKVEIPLQRSARNFGHSYYLVFNHFYDRHSNLDLLCQFVKFCFLQESAVFLIVYEPPLSHIVPLREEANQLTVKEVFKLLLDPFKNEGIAVVINEFPIPEKVFKPTVCILGYSRAQHNEEAFQLQRFIDQIHPPKGLNIHQLKQMDGSEGIRKTIIFKTTSLDHSLPHYNGFVLRAVDNIDRYFQSFQFSADDLKVKLNEKAPALYEELLRSFRLTAEELLPGSQSWGEISKIVMLVLVIGGISWVADWSEFEYSKQFAERVQQETAWLQNWFGDVYVDLCMGIAFSFKLLASMRSVNLAREKLLAEFSKCCCGRGQYQDKFARNILIAVFIAAFTTTLPELQFIRDVITSEGMRYAAYVLAPIETTSRAARGLLNFVPQAAHVQKNEKNARRSLLEELNLILEPDDQLSPEQIEAISAGQAYVRPDSAIRKPLMGLIALACTWTFSQTQFLSSLKAAMDGLSSIGFGLGSEPSSPFWNLLAVVKLFGLLLPVVAATARTGLYSFASYTCINTAWDLLWHTPAIPDQTNPKKAHESNSSQVASAINVVIGVLITMGGVFGFASSGSAGKIYKYMDFSVLASMLLAIPATAPFFASDAYFAIKQVITFATEKIRLSPCRPNFAGLYGANVPSLVRTLMENLRVKRDITELYFDTLSITDENYPDYCKKFGLSNTADIGMQNTVFVTQSGGYSSFQNDRFSDLVEAIRFLRIYLDEDSYERVLKEPLGEQEITEETHLLSTI